VGWFFRKSIRLLPGVRINLSKSGPRLSIGVPGIRASIDTEGKTRIYGGMGPIRYQKSITANSVANPPGRRQGVLTFMKMLLGGHR
jgi:hypothetical protein